MINDKNWEKILTPDQYKILRLKHTEIPFTGKYLYFDQEGSFLCAGCDHLLFLSTHKYDSNSGWPSFFKTAHQNSVDLKPDPSFQMHRTEVLCKNCQGHLGHLFNDSKMSTGLRYCINSLSLKFSEKT